MVEVLDNDIPGVAVNPTSLSITEGGSDSYTLVLTKAPTATVTVEISGAAGDVSVSRSRVSFSTSNWNREQTVTVRVSEDDDAVTDAAVTLTHTVTGADEYEDPPFTISPVTVTPKENDMRGVSVNPTSLTIAAGVSGTYRVRLNTEPTDAVDIEVDSPTDDVTVTGSPLVFTPQNWSSEQTVTVTVAEDAGSDEPQSVTLTHTVRGGDYLGVEAASVTVTIPVEGTPGAPRGLTATGGDQQVTLSWNAPASDGGTPIVRYEYRSQEGGSGFTSWTPIPGGASATSYTVTGLDNGTSFTFEVRAVNGVGGGQGATASATLAESVPGAPSGLTATGGDESVTLNWSAPGDGGSQILRYEYRYAASGRVLQRLGDCQRWRERKEPHHQRSDQRHGLWIPGAGGERDRRRFRGFLKPPRRLARLRARRWDCRRVSKARPSRSCGVCRPMTAAPRLPATKCATGWPVDSGATGWPWRVVRVPPATP